MAELIVGVGRYAVKLEWWIAAWVVDGQERRVSNWLSAIVPGIAVHSAVSKDGLVGGRDFKSYNRSLRLGG